MISDANQAALVERLVRVMSLHDHNTRVVALGTTMLGVTAAIVGVFALLRKRSLVGDVVGHASLPGIAIAFLFMETIWPGNERSTFGLLFGATVAGLAGVICTTAIRRFTRIKEDAALSIVLGVFFGMGIVLFTVIQSIPTGNSAGLNKFIFGSAASMLAADARLIVEASAVTLIVSLLLFKELSLVCFDESFAAVNGWPTRFLDLLLMGLIVAVAEIGAQCVGLVLVAALMVIPAAAARFWSDRLSTMTVVAALLGGISSFFGVLISGLAPRLAAGAIVILACGAAFFFSLMFGNARGIFWKWRVRRQAEAKIGRTDLLRALYEFLESHPPSLADGIKADKVRYEQSVSVNELRGMRNWNAQRLARLLRAAERDGLVERLPSQSFRFTKDGIREAAAAVRNHRLWELFLIHYAAISPTHVDRDADEIEHVLGASIIAELEQLLEHDGRLSVPDSPHQVRRPLSTGAAKD